MGLCGSFRCGCGVTSTAATTGAIGGELPSILVSGSGEPGDPYDLQLNDAWAAEVAALPRGVMARAEVTTSGSANPGSTGLLAAPTFTAVAGRRYRITITWYSATVVGSGTHECQIWRGLGGSQLAAVYIAPSSGNWGGGSLVTEDVPGAGSVAYVFYTYTNATSVQIIAGSGAPFGILVEDIGLA